MTIEMRPTEVPEYPELDTRQADSGADSIQDVPEAAGDNEERIPGFITTADSLVVRLADADRDGEYVAVLTPDERDKVPVIVENPASSTEPYVRGFHLDSVARAVLMQEGEQRVWRELPTRNVISPVVTKDGIKIAILGSETPDRS